MDSEPQPTPAQKPAARATPAAKPSARTKPAARSSASADSVTESTTAPAKKTAAQKAAAQKITAQKTPTQKTTAQKTPTQKTTAQKTPAQKTTAQRPTVAKKPAPPRASGTRGAAATKPASERQASPVGTQAAAASVVRTATSSEAPAAAPASNDQVGAAPAKSGSPKRVPVKRAPATKAPLAKTPVKSGAAPSARAAAAKRPAATAKTTVAAKAVAANTEAAAVDRDEREVVLTISGLSKHFDDTLAVDNISLEVRAGSFFGVVGPNGAGKTTTLSMVTGLLRPDQGTITVHGADVWGDPVAAKRNMGVLPDRLRLFDRLSGAQFLYYSAVLRGLDKATARKRLTDLAFAFGLEDSLNRLVTDYSAGMTKKIALAAAMIHSPRLLVLDEPFESVDPVSAANITEILKQYAAAGGTVVLSSHSMDLVQRICDDVAVVVGGAVLASGTMAEVREGKTLEERFIELAGGRTAAEGLEWLHSFSD